MTVKGSLNLRQLPKMLFHSIQTQNLNLISTPELKCFGSRRTKLQQQSSQQEELQRQRVEMADLQQVSFCPSCCMKSVIICIQYFLFAHVKTFLYGNNELDITSLRRKTNVVGQGEMYLGSADWVPADDVQSPSHFYYY